MPRFCVQPVKIFPRGVKDAFVIAVFPEGDSTVTHGLDGDIAIEGIESPYEPPCGCIEGDCPKSWARNIDYAADYDRIALHLRTTEGVLSIIGPSYLYPVYVLAIDPCQ